MANEGTKIPAKNSVMIEEQEDEMMMLEAMRKKELEFQWEVIENKVEGTMRVELELPNQGLPIKIDPECGIYSESKFKALDTLATVLYLPPIKLHFQLNHLYPLEEPPSFSLSCCWLNFSQLGVLCRNLDQIWKDQCGAPVLYQWQQFLAHESMTVLGIDGLLAIKYQNPRALQSDWDARGIQEMKNLFSIVPLLVEYDNQQRTIVFQSSHFTCQICCVNISGSECIRLQSCPHVTCKECMVTYLTSKIGDGSVATIDCPGSNCREPILPGLIQRLISPQLFERYDKLLLQRTLDGMTDIVYCPRPTCRCVTLKEEDSNMALCPNCKFSFCVLCKRTWHGISPCKMLPQDIKELKEAYETGDKELQKSLELQYGKKYLERAFQEYESSSWIKSNTKPCPNCHSTIEKDHGCNKMACLTCNCQFCWLCGTALPRHNPYNHYHPGNSACGGKLFEGELPEENDELIL